MFETNNQYKAEVMAVSSNEALNLNKNPRVQATQATQADGGEDGEQTAQTGEGQGPGLTMKQAQEALEMFVDEEWLRKSRYVPLSLLVTPVYILILTPHPIKPNKNTNESNIIGAAGTLSHPAGCWSLATISNKPTTTKPTRRNPKTLIPHP